MDKISESGYRWALVYVITLAMIGFFTASDQEIVQGFAKIMVCNNVLISDYFEIVGIGATFVNVAIVTLVTIALMYFNNTPMNGMGIITLGLMSGFSFFGKNIFNMWFILGGTYLYCFVKKEKFSRHILVSLLSTSLSPLISSTFFGNDMTLKGICVSIICGLIIGFVMPMLAAHTDKLLHGLNLYNGGFAIGLLALVMVPVLKSYGFDFMPVNYWSTGHNIELSLLLYGTSCCLIFSGFCMDMENALKNYKNILKRPGLPSQDFTVLDGMGAVLINIGINGIVGTSYILLIGGDLNGPTIAGILAVMGFGAKGKHIKNIIPVMIGVAIGGITKQWSPTEPSAQLAALFGTALAPVAGTYGFFPGIIAGFIHSSVVLQAGLGYSGVNLYNNGFAAGITSIVLYPVLAKFIQPNTYSDPSPSMVMTKFMKIANTIEEKEK